MIYFICIGGFLTVWTLLLVFSGERQRLLTHIEIAQQIKAAAELEAERKKNAPPKKK